MATDLNNYKVKNELEKLKDAIVKYTPDNEGLVNTIKALTPKNSLLINALIEEWNAREIPELSEKDIIKQNMAYQSRKGRQDDLVEVGMDPNDLVHEKRWILKSRDGWLGWIPEAQAYTDMPLIYGGDLDYDKIFERKVLKYQVSGTINLYRTMKKFLKTFISMGLTDRQICEILLELCKKHVPHQYSSLARHTENAGKLWVELASSLNNDVEESKVRKALCNVSRKVSEPINLPLYSIKSLYDQILDLTHPGLDPNIHEQKATQHACKCIEFLVSKGIKKLFDNYQRDKVVHSESINLVELVNMITQQENTKEEYRITQTMYLPPACSTLDIQPQVNTSTEQITVMRNESWQNKKDERSNKDYYPRSRSNSNGYGRKVDDNNKNYQETRRYSRNDASSRYHGEKPYFRNYSGERRRNYSGENRRGYSQDRSDKPRYEQRQRSGDRYKSYGSQRNNGDASPYRGDGRRAATPNDRNSRGDRSNNNNNSENYRRRESRSPANRSSHDSRGDRQNTGSVRRRSGDYQRQDSRPSPARGDQSQQRRRSASRESGDGNIKCRRCGDKGHRSEKCEQFPFWRGKPCDCGFLHKRRDCNMRYGAHVTEMDTEDRRHDERDDALQLYSN
jgi:hypothetical protein